MFCILIARQTTLLRILLSMALLTGSLGAVGAENNLEALKSDLSFFTDPSCGQLKAGVKSNDLAAFKSELLKNSGGRDAERLLRPDLPGGGLRGLSLAARTGQNPEAGRWLQPLREHHRHLPGSGRTRGAGGEHGGQGAFAADSGLDAQAGRRHRAHQRSQRLGPAQAEDRAPGGRECDPGEEGRQRVCELLR